MKIARLRRLVAGALLAVPLPRLGGQPTTGPVIELPAITVTNTRLLPPPESWRYAELPGLEVLSSVSAASSERLIRDFLVFRQCLAIVWPALGPNANVPTVLIICGPGRFDAFRPAGAGTADPFQSVCLGDHEQNVIIIHGESGAPAGYDPHQRPSNQSPNNLQILAANNLDQTGDVHGMPGIPGQLADPGQVLVAPGGGLDGPPVVRNDAATRLHRDYVQFLLERIQPRPPAWLEEGLAQLLMSMEYTDKEIQFAKIESNEGTSRLPQPANNPEASQHGTPGSYTGRSAPTPSQLGLRHAPAPPLEDQNFNIRLLASRLLPLDRMFATGHDSADVATGITSEWAAQCAAFVDLGLYGNREKYQKGFLAFVDRTSREPVSEELFRQCFGMSYKEMLFALAAHVDMTAAATFEFRPARSKGFDQFPPPPPFELRAASAAEVGRIKGSALLLAGHPDQAHLELIAPYVRGERDPQLLAALGLDELDRQQPDRARPFLEAAVAGGTSRTRAYLELGRLRYAEAQAHAGGPGGLLDAAQLDRVLDPLRRGRNLFPAEPAIDALMAEVSGHADIASAPRADLVLARQLYAEALAHPAAPNGRLDAAQLAQVLNPLFQGRNLRPVRPETYELMAQAWLHAAALPSAGNLAVIDEGVLRFPRDAALAYDDAVLKLKRGDQADAAALISLGLGAASSFDELSRFVALQDALPAPPSR